MNKKNYKGKIGYCDNKVLNLRDKNGKVVPGGHYVYIREINDNKCNINIITSLIDKKDKSKIDINKIKKIEKGYFYPIPKKDANFSEWSAINLSGNINNINISKIQNIGQKSIKRRHKWFVGKFTKKEDSK